MPLQNSTGTPYGTFSYNGLSLSEGTDSIDVKSEKVRDDADRTVIHQRITITWSGVLAAPSGSNVQSDLTLLRQKLSQDGKVLIFKDKGFGEDLIVNSPTNPVKDVNFGPKTEIMSWKSLGGSQAAKVTWSVTVCVPECCCGDAERFTGVMAINYSVSHSYSLRGTLTRSYSGYIQIAMTRAADNTIPDSADRYRNHFSPEPPLGFTRTHDWTLSLNKARVDFTIVDTEIESPNPYPSKVISISGRHRMSWSRREASRYYNSINVSIDRAVDLSGPTAYLIFLQIVQQRLFTAKQQKSYPFIMDLEVEEDLFGYPCEFSLRYRMLGCLKDVIAETGLWSPIQGTSWAQWKASLANSMFSTFGTSNIGHLPSHDVIIDLCSSQSAAIDIAAFKPVPDAGPSMAVTNDKPPKDVSWIQYDAQLIPYRRRTVVQQQISQSADIDQSSDISSSADFDYGPSGGTSDIIQEGGQSKHGVIFKGRAVRAGHKISRPKITAIGGQTAVERGSAHRLRNVGDFFGQNVYQLDWIIDYAVPNSPGQVKPEDNLEDC